jgi:hypothetical protein
MGKLTITMVVFLLPFSSSTSHIAAETLRAPAATVAHHGPTVARPDDPGAMLVVVSERIFFQG